MAVILWAPPSLSHALTEVHEGSEPLVPRIQSTPEAFFQRCRDLSWKFFAEVFRRFVQALLPDAPARFCRPLQGLQKRFTDVLIIDGSRLAAIAHRLKILWDVRSVVLPGCLLGVYDLFRGIPRALDFCADAACSEMLRAFQMLRRIKPGTLIVGDRLYCAAAFFEKLGSRKLWGLFRRNRCLGLRKGTRLRKRRYQGGCLQEWLACAGGGTSAPAQTVRLIRFKKGRTVYELLTNVLDPEQLTGEEAMALYPCRWKVERMYFDLKEVLNLNRFYAANPNAVGMQVYAGAMVYTAMRVAQGQVAEQAGIEPEEISPAKFFPKMAASCHGYVVTERVIADIVRMNPGKELRLPDYTRRRFASLELDAILVERRNPHRRQRRFCAARRRWKSFKHIRGGRELSKWPRITSSIRAWADHVVPLSQDGFRAQVEIIHVLVGYLEALFVRPIQKAGPYSQPLLCPGRSDVVEHLLIAGERLPRPVLGDEAEQPVLDGVPL
jgi:hypothetical protein